MSSTIAGGRIGECSPRTIRVGAAMRSRSGQLSVGRRAPLACRIEAVHEAPVPLDDALPRHVLEEGGRRHRLAGQEPEARERRREGLVAPGAPVAALVHPVEPVRRQGRPAVDDDEGGEPLGMPGREGHRVVPAHRVAGERHPLPAEGIRHAEEVAGEVRRRIRGRRVTTRSRRGRAGRATTMW